MCDTVKHFKWSYLLYYRSDFADFFVELRIKFPFTYVETSKIWDVGLHTICCLIKKLPKSQILTDFFWFSKMVKCVQKS